MPTEDPLRELGRSVAQLHLKLSRVQERLEQLPVRVPAQAPSTDLDVLLDLLDAVEAALERQPERRRWFRNTSASIRDVWRGLNVAAADARERLQRAGIEPTPVAGAFDPMLHRAIEVVPPAAGGREGMIATTHRRGWLRHSGAERAVLRTAQVSVHGVAP